MKWLNIYLLRPWQQKWVQQLQGERWRTGLDEGLNTKQLNFFTESYWATFSDLVLFLFEWWHFEPGWGEWGGWSPASQPPRPPPPPPAPEDVWSMASHILYTAIYSQLQYQRVVVGVVIVVVQLVIIQLICMAKTQLVTIGGRSCWVIADTSISGRLELDFQF